LFASVAFPTPTRDLYTYSVPEPMRASVVPGIRVHAPLGRRHAVGMVVAVTDTPPGFETKPLKAPLDTAPVLDAALLALTRQVADATFCSWGEAIQAALPLGLNFVSERRIRVGDTAAHIPPAGADILQDLAAIGDMPLEEAERRWGDRILDRLIESGAIERYDEPRRRIGDEAEWVLAWAADGAHTLRHQPKKAAWWKRTEALADLDLPMPTSRVMDETGLKEHNIRRLVDLGILESVRRAVRRVSADAGVGPLATLNGEQQAAYEAILEGYSQSRPPVLLFGVTGSGKTEVYMHALAECRRRGKGGIVMVPEIALTPQTVNRFRAVFGESVAVMHSRLTDRERYNAWSDIRAGRRTIVIGARSAVFAPVPDLGLIVIDEEHDASYRQEDPAPRYDAREVARMRAEAAGAVLVMGSATPDLGSLFATAKGEMRMLRLTRRHGTAELPPVVITDLRQYRKAMRGPVAVPVFLALEEVLSRGEQAIVLYNRRGYARFLMCEACGHTPECPDCSVTLTYHRTTHTLRCHYCGHSHRAPATCPSCDDPAITEQGSGTQKVEEELAALFPAARILRMDRDTTAKRDAHASILRSFGAGEADILVGTQLVSKGLDFPNVTLVVVVNADTELAFPRYDGAERMFQLLTQVAGRSGRAGKPGRVFLQSYKADHPALIHAATHDFEAFARQEMASRKPLSWPPYSHVVTFHLRGADSTAVAAAAHALTRAVEAESGGWPVLGPAPASIVRIQKDFRWEVLVKCDRNLGIDARVDWLERVFRRYQTDRPAGASAVRIHTASAR
jgi:primosomal protein N' (replication factor Y)